MILKEERMSSRYGQYRKNVSVYGKRGHSDPHSVWKRFLEKWYREIQ